MRLGLPEILFIAFLAIVIAVVFRMMRRGDEGGVARPCPKCGKALPPNAQFCRDCGGRL